MTHTPAPWAIRTLENFGFNVVHYINGDKFDIARVAKCGSEADARLIAASPELLEACVEFVRRVEAGEIRSKLTYATMKAVIAKAKGEQS